MNGAGERSGGSGGNDVRAVGREGDVTEDTWTKFGMADGNVSSKGRTTRKMGEYESEASALMISPEV